MRCAAALVGFMLLAACNRGGIDAAPPPREVSDASVSQFCGMTLTEHSGPKAQIFVRGVADPYWFATVRDALAFAILPEMPQAISAIYVNDMARAKNWDQPEAGTWVDAHQASYVIDSRRRGGMNADEAIPFGDPAAAREFVTAYGGRVVGFADIPRDYVLSTKTGDR